MEEPLNDGQIRALLERDLLRPEDAVRSVGDDDWVAIRQTRLFSDASGASKGAASHHDDQQPPTTRRTEASEESEAIFEQLVQDSWDRYQSRERATEVDEVLVGAVITATLENGYSLIDLDSDGQNHYLRFENLDSGDRTIFELDHRAESLTTAEIIGHEASVTIGYGERVSDFNSVWNALKQEMQGGYIMQPDPGVITVDGDMSSQYIYVQVRMLWNIEDYLEHDDPYQIRYKKMTRDIGATVDVLREYLEGRLQQTQS